MSLPIFRPRTTQPQYNATINRNSPLGRVLDYAWVGNNLSGIDRIQKLAAPIPGVPGLSASPRGMAITNTGAEAPTYINIPAILTFPYILIGYGYFSNGSNDWQLGNLASSGLGYIAAIRLESSSTAGFIIQSNYGSAQVITITVPGINAGTPVCRM